jgi:myosin heavy subunit
LLLFIYFFRGESGAGKTENTKKVIQYLTSVASERTSGKQTDSLEQQILRANPILESFGNAQTIRNNNSSRFGKFIRIEFSSGGQIAGANLEKYLLEKSRVTRQNPKERNYHVFYQFMKGAPQELKEKFLITGDLNEYSYTKNTNHNIDGIDDRAEFMVLKESMEIMNFSPEQQSMLFRVISAVLHLSNIQPTSDRDDQAQLRDTSAAEKLCHVLGIPLAEFTKSLLKPRVQAGREWIAQARTVGQVLYSIEALARSLYERMFGQLVEWINKVLDRNAAKSHFIGVLDIAGFEIFDSNNFEQLLINYTNEKLQQFFNHHMFEQEQEEYRREGIQWKFIDFGLDLQPTIDLIEKVNPMGILSCLDEECLMPKATDKTFTHKLITSLEKSDKFETMRFTQGFILHHYASKVEYSTDGWLDRNKDPLNENISTMLASSTDANIALLFEDHLSTSTSSAVRSRTKKGLFRTAGQRHREQLNLLMNQLHSTEPHFVRCILPNQEKKPGKINTLLVLDQLRCNGVLEGIRICRAGFPNRLSFSEFRQRYEILVPKAIPKGYMDGKEATIRILKGLDLDPSKYSIGSSKVFFRAGELAELEETRDATLSRIVSSFQAVCRGYLAHKKYRKRIEQLKAIKIIQKNARVYVQLREWSWWKLYTKVKPLLNVTRTDEELKKREEAIKTLEDQVKSEMEARSRLEQVQIELVTQKEKLDRTLQSERDLALENQEILKRTQLRERSLEDDIQALTEELESMEGQLEEIAQTKVELASRQEALMNQIEEERAMATKIDKERGLKESEIEQLRAELDIERQTLEQMGSDRSSLEAKIEELQNILSTGESREMELVKARTKFEGQIQELANSLEAESKSKSQLEDKKVQLEADLKSLREQMSQLEASNKDLRSQLSKRETEFSNLSTQYKTESESRVSIDKQRRDLNMKMEALENELKIEQEKSDHLQSSKSKLESELTELRSLIEAKGDEETKQQELRRMKEDELSNLRDQLDQCQQDLVETRRANLQTIESLKSELDAKVTETASLLKAKDILESQVNELSSDLDSTHQSLANSEKVKRQLEFDLESLTDRAGELETSLASLKTSKDTIEKNLISANSYKEESESNLNRLERDKQTLERQVDLFKTNLEQEVLKREASDLSRKKLTTEIADLQAQLEENEQLKFDLRSKLSEKVHEIETLKDGFSTETNSRVIAIEEVKRNLEMELAELQPAYEDLLRTRDNLEKTKNRLISENEDLKHDIDREHSATRAAEKQLKQTESQISSLNVELETERQSIQVLESSLRKLQTAHDSIQTQLSEKENSLFTLTKSKTDMETELRALINEIGDGGKNVHELEKSKRRLEAQLEEKVYLLEQAEQTQSKSEELRRKVEEQFRDYQIRMEDELAKKETQLEETRRLLLKEVNQLGQRLDEEIDTKNELIKGRKALESEIEDLRTNVTYSTQSKSELEKAKKKAEEIIKDLTASLEAEEKSRYNFQELSQRHEKKSNTLQSEMEKLDLQVEALEKVKRNLEQKVEDLTAELEENQSQGILMENIRRLEKEKLELQEMLDEETEARATLQNLQRNDTELESLKNQIREEMNGQLEKIEESRRALLVAQRIAQQELEDCNNKVLALEDQKRTVQQELLDTKQKLEDEIMFRNEESAARRRVTLNYNELSVKFESELNKSAELTELVDVYKNKVNHLSSNQEDLEIQRSKFERNEASLKTQLSELEENLQHAIRRCTQSEEKSNALELQLLELERKVEGDEAQYFNLSNNKESLLEELHLIREETQRDLEERDRTLESLRVRFQQQVSDLNSELEAEKHSLIRIRQTNRSLEAEIEELSTKLDDELRASSSWKREKEKMEAKLNELTNSYYDGLTKTENLTEQVTKLTYQNSQLQMEFEDSQLSKQNLEKIKRQLEQKLEDIGDQFSSADKNRIAIERSLSEKGEEATKLQELLEETHEETRIINSKLRKAELAAQDSQSQLLKEQEHNAEILKEKLTLEKQIKDLNLKIVDLESTTLSNPLKGFSRLTQRFDELSAQFDMEAQEKNATLRNARKSDRQIRDLQFQLQEKDKTTINQQAIIEKHESKIERLKSQLEQMVISFIKHYIYFILSLNLGGF